MAKSQKKPGGLRSKIAIAMAHPAAEDVAEDAVDRPPPRRDRTANG